MVRSTDFVIDVYLYDSAELNINNVMYLKQTTAYFARCDKLIDTRSGYLSFEPHFTVCAAYNIKQQLFSIMLNIMSVWVNM
jgi:hypothetical protein